MEIEFKLNVQLLNSYFVKINLLRQKAEGSMRQNMNLKTERG